MKKLYEWKKVSYYNIYIGNLFYFCFIFCYIILHSFACILLLSFCSNNNSNIFNICYLRKKALADSAVSVEYKQY